MNPNACRTALITVAFILASTIWADEPAKQQGPTAKQAASKTAKACEGTLIIDSKTYRLEHGVAFVTKVLEEEQFAILVSSKPIPVDKLKKALHEGQGSDDRFFFFEPHAKLTFHKSGEVGFLNAWADNSSISVSGSNLKGDVEIKDGRIRGTATLTAEDDDPKPHRLQVRFDLEVLETPASAKPPMGEKAKSTGTEQDKDDDDDKNDESGDDDAAPQFRVRDLPFPSDAQDIEYKQLVEQVVFRTPADVKMLVTFLSRELKKQGWTSDGSDLVTPKSAILNRAKGKATLTLFVKPAEQGTQVMIMTSGLSWDTDEERPDDHPPAGDGDPDWPAPQRAG